MEKSIRKQIDDMIIKIRQPKPGWYEIAQWSTIVGLSFNQMARKIRTLEQLKKAKRMKIKQFHGFKTYFWINNISETLLHESNTRVPTAGGDVRVRNDKQGKGVQGNRRGNKRNAPNLPEARS